MRLMRLVGMNREYRASNSATQCITASGNAFAAAVAAKRIRHGDPNAAKDRSCHSPVLCTLADARMRSRTFGVVVLIESNQSRECVESENLSAPNLSVGGQALA